MISANKKMNDTIQEKNVTGMCVSCSHQEDCAMTHHGGTNLYGCEEYESMPVAGASVDYREEMKVATVLGLCATCEHKNQCAHKTTPGGVWHCEEYQ